MKIISDIRLYKSSVSNIDGNSLPAEIGNFKANIALNRIVMKLREQQFSLADFHHLYVNFTICECNNVIKPAERSIDKYYPWFRYYDVGIEPEIYDELHCEKYADMLLARIENVLLMFFCHGETDEKIIRDSFEQALTLGENMLINFKVKQSSKYDAVIYLRILDSGKYFPLLCVYDKAGKEVLKADMPIINTLDSIGEIKLSSKKVTVQPKNNSWSYDLEPIEIELK